MQVKFRIFTGNKSSVIDETLVFGLKIQTVCSLQSIILFVKEKNFSSLSYSSSHGN